MPIRNVEAWVRSVGFCSPGPAPNSFTPCRSYAALSARGWTVSAAVIGRPWLVASILTSLGGSWESKLRQSFTHARQTWILDEDVRNPYDASSRQRAVDRNAEMRAKEVDCTDARKLFRDVEQLHPALSDAVAYRSL